MMAASPLSVVPTQGSLLQQIIDGAPSPIFLKDREGRFITINAALEKMLGIGHAELRGKTDYDLFPKDRADYYRAHDRRVTETGESLQVEEIADLPDGHHVFLATKFPLRDEAGKVFGVCAISHDITARKQAEEALHLTQEKFAKAFALNPAGIVLTRLQDGKVLEANDAALNIFGYSREEAIGSSVALQHWPTLEERARFVQELREKGFFAREQTLLRKSGEPFVSFGSATLLRVADEEIILSTWLDITARKRAEEALRESEELLRAVTDNSDDAIYVKDSESRWLMANPALLKIVAKPLQEVLGKTDAEIYADPAIGAAILANDAQVVQRGEPEAFEEMAQTPAGIRLFLSTKAPRRDTEGRVNGVIGISRDITDRKQVEAALRDSRNKYRALIEATADFVWEMDPLGRYTYCSPQMETLWGMKPHEMIGKTPFDVMPEEHKQAAAESFHELMQSPRPFRGLQSTAYDASGRLIHLEISGVPFFADDGSLLGFRGTTRDITERKQAEAALRESEQREHERAAELQTIFDTAPIGLAIGGDAQGHHIRGNRANEEMFGLPPGAELSKAGPQAALFRVFQDGRELAVADLPMQRAIRGEVVREQIVEVVREDGQALTIYAKASPLLDEAGGPRGAVGAFLDITALNQAERALRESEARERARAHELQAVLDAVPAAVWIAHDPLATQITGNRLSQEWINPPQGVNGSQSLPDPKTVRAFKDGVEIPPSQMPVAMSAAGREIRDYEFDFVYPDGSVRHVLGNASPLRDDCGQLRGSVSAFVDITERKRALDVAIRSEKVAALGRMAASLAHDINNPLAAAMNTVFIARNDAVCAACAHSVRQYLDLADEELKRISHITRQALGFYREGSVPAKVSVRAILDEAVDIFKSKIKSKRARIEKEYEGELVEVIGISGELRQVFSNLLVNSLDAIAEHGTIKLRVSTSPQRGVRITIADNGSGIDPVARPRIFEPLFTTKGPLGTGLGLWVTKQLVDKHSGSIRVHSSTSGSRRGTSFTVVLPAASTTHAKVETRSSLVNA